ncbi:MAG: hypothetical protein WC803_13530 [Sphingomonas sp.]|jgi:hypothetical protein
MAQYASYAAGSNVGRRTVYAGEARDLERMLAETLLALYDDGYEYLTGLRLAACGDGHVASVSVEVIDNVNDRLTDAFLRNTSAPTTVTPDAAVVFFQCDNRRDVEAERTAAIARLPASHDIVSTECVASSKGDRLFGMIVAISRGE